MSVKSIVVIAIAELIYHYYVPVDSLIQYLPEDHLDCVL